MLCGGGGGRGSGSCSGSGVVAAASLWRGGGGGSGGGGEQVLSMSSFPCQEQLLAVKIEAFRLFSVGGGSAKCEW